LKLLPPEFLLQAPGLVHPAIGVLDHVKGIDDHLGPRQHLLHDLSGFLVHVDRDLPDLRPALRRPALESTLQGLLPIVSEDPQHPALVDFGDSGHELSPPKAVLIDAQLEPLVSRLAEQLSPGDPHVGPCDHAP
jgi:hypothetical protein